MSDHGPGPFGAAARRHWALDPAITYLNHGTVGAPPRRILEVQAGIRDAIERQPSRFLLRELCAVSVGPSAARPRLREAADAVAAFVGARGDDLVFTDNVTAGINAVLGSLSFTAGDEILLTDLRYGAIENVAAWIARRTGATVRVVEMSPPFHPDTVVEVVAGALGPRTRLAILDHITAETALVLPLARLAAACRLRGIPVLADGAHAPGAIALDIPTLGVDWYAANLHKWAWTPRSCGFLWAAPDRQAGLHPPVISWGLDQGFTTEFDWAGTRDPSPWLAAPAAIDLLREFDFKAVREHNHGLAWSAACHLAGRWGTSLEMPESMVGTMATVPLPAGLGSLPEEAKALRLALLDEDRIEVQLHSRRGRLHVRVSAQIYNDMADVERLAASVLARTT